MAPAAQLTVPPARGQAGAQLSPFETDESLPFSLVPTPLRVAIAVTEIRAATEPYWTAVTPESFRKKRAISRMKERPALAILVLELEYGGFHMSHFLSPYNKVT